MYCYELVLFNSPSIFLKLLFLCMCVRPDTFTGRRMLGTLQNIQEDKHNLSVIYALLVL